MKEIPSTETLFTDDGFIHRSSKKITIHNPSCPTCSPVSYKNRRDSIPFPSTLQIPNPIPTHLPNPNTKMTDRTQKPKPHPRPPRAPPQPPPRRPDEDVDRRHYISFRELGVRGPEEQEEFERGEREKKEEREAGAAAEEGSKRGDVGDGRERSGWMGWFVGARSVSLLLS